MWEKGVEKESGERKKGNRKVNILTNGVPVMYTTLRSCRLDLYHYGKEGHVERN